MFYVCLLPYGIHACSREPIPFDCSISASLPCLWFVQGSLFPLISVQQACLDYVLFKGLCSLFLILLVSSVFLIYNILTFDQKKYKLESCLTHGIVNYYLVTDDAWNRQRKQIHSWRMKSAEKTESFLMHGIISENYVSADQKSSAKTEWLKT